MSFFVRHQNMLISYGISIDKEATSRDRVKHTARRVGLLVRDEDYTLAAFKPTPSQE